MIWEGTVKTADGKIEFKAEIDIEGSKDSLEG
jgi:hypothetical protein